MSLTLLLSSHFSLAGARTVPPSEDSRDYIGSTWVVQDTPHFKVPNPITSAKSMLPRKAAESQVLGIRTRFGGRYSAHCTTHQHPNGVGWTPEKSMSPGVQCWVAGPVGQAHLSGSHLAWPVSTSSITPDIVTSPSLGFLISVTSVLNLGRTDIWGGLIFCCVEQHSWPPSARCQQHTPPLPVATTQNAPRHCQMPLRGQTRPVENCWNYPPAEYPQVLKGSLKAKPPRPSNCLACMVRANHP